MKADTDGDANNPELVIRVKGTINFKYSDFSGIQDSDADIGDDLKVIVADHLVNDAEDGAVSFTVAGLDSDATAVVTFKDSSGKTVTANVSGNGTFDIDLTSLDDGNVTVSIKATDTAGNTADGTGDSLELDTFVAAPTLTLSNDTGSLNDDLITNDGSLTTGGTEAGATVEYSSDGMNWSGTLPVAAEGSNTVFVRQTDVAGNVSGPGSITFTLDTTAPAAPTVVLTSDTGSSNGDGITNNGSLTVTPAEAGGTIEYSADGGTTWSASFSAVEGANSVQVRQVDAAGNKGAAASLNFTLDTTAPAAPTITAVNDDAAPVLGSLSSGGYTNNARPTLTITAEAGATVMVYDGATHLGTATETSTTGTFTFTPSSDLSNGGHTLTAKATDSAGNTSGPSSAFGVNVDTIAPVAGTLSFTDLSDTGSDNSPDITQDNVFSLDLAGTSDANATTTVYQQSLNGGAWTDLLSSAISGLADGSYQYRAVVTDAAGNSSESNAISVIVDNTAPVVGALSFTGLTDTGSDNVPDITQDNAFSLNLASASDANGTTTVYQQSLNGGAWTDLLSSAISGLADGSYQYRAVVTDAAGNSSESNAISVIVDNTAPVAGTLSLANYTGGADNTFDLSLGGTSDANPTSTAYEVSTNGGSSWSSTGVNQVNLAAGSYLFRAVVTDAAGNNSTSNAVNVAVQSPILSPPPPPGPDPNDFDGFIASGGGVVNGTSANEEFSNNNGANFKIPPGNIDHTINAMGGDDVVWSGNGIDTVYGGDGSDTIHGESGNDQLYGQAGVDFVYGDGDQDTIFGGSGNDILEGNSGDDTIYGGSNIDTINGGEGADILIGGYGADNLTGGNGNDTFRYLSLSDGGDTIMDYALGQDVIDIDALLNNASFAHGVTTAGLANYVQFNSTTHVLAVDVNGTGNFTHLATVNNATSVNVLFTDADNHVVTIAAPTIT